MRSGGLRCGGALVAPDWVITAYHCVAQESPVIAVGNILVYYDGPSSEFDIEDEDCATEGTGLCRHDFNSCYVRPFTTGSNEVDECGDGFGDNIPVGRDLALVHLDTPVVGINPRNIEPPRSCRPESEFRFAFRGQGPSGLDPFGLARLATFGVGLRSAVGEEQLRALFDEPTRFEGGDSGGALTREDDDLSGPVVGIAAAIPRFGDPIMGRGATIWQTEHIEWIWSVLDASGSCEIGTGPCVLREPVPDGGSVCGDRHCTGEEDFDSCAVDCSPALRDADGDGLPDVRDLCPYLDARVVPADRVVNGNHIDEDGDRLGDDCTPEGCAGACSPDPDRDGVPSACDICPNDFDPEQLDTDGDSIGDACDVCPATPDADQANSDDDGFGDACDNCPEVTNPTQANCNADAETANPYPDRPQGFGDACDPVPCGETRLGQSDEFDDTGTIRVIRNNLVQVEGHALDAQEARTGFRFCRCSLADLDVWDPLDPDRPAVADDPRIRAERVLEAGSATQPNGDCGIDDRIAYGLANELAPWRWVGLEHDALTELFGAELREEAITTYELRDESTFTPRLTALWDVDEDRARWGRTTGESFTEEMPGILWTHTPGDRDSAFADEIATYASHYWSGVIEPPTEARRPHPCLRHVGPWIDDAACPFCASSFPAAFLGYGGVLGGSGCEGPFSPPLLALPDLPYELGDLLPFDPGPVLREDRRWVAPAEPAEWLPHAGVRLVGVEGLGVQLSPVVRLDASPFGLVPTGIDLCPNNQCQDPFLTAARASEPDLPEEPVLVLSARRGELWALQSGSEESIGRLWAFDLEESSRAAYPLELGTVHAATYQAQDDTLYVLDEVRLERRGRHRRHPRRQMRLVRIEPGAAPAMDVVAQWPRASRNNRFALAPTIDGGLWLLASRHRGGHWVVRLNQSHGHWRLSAWTRQRQPLAQVQARVDARGISYVVEGREGEEIVGVGLIRYGPSAIAGLAKAFFDVASEPCAPC